MNALQQIFADVTSYYVYVDRPDVDHIQLKHAIYTPDSCPRWLFVWGSGYWEARESKYNNSRCLNHGDSLEDLLRAYPHF